MYESVQPELTKKGLPRKRPYYGGGGHSRTIQENAYLRPLALKMYRKGLSTVRIARILKISSSTVTYWVKQAGIMRTRAQAAVIARRERRRRQLDKLIAIARHHYLIGDLSVKEIAERMHVKPGRVYHWMRITKSARTRSDSLKLRHARKKKRAQEAQVFQLAA